MRGENPLPSGREFRSSPRHFRASRGIQRTARLPAIVTSSMIEKPTQSALTSRSG